MDDTFRRGPLLLVSMDTATIRNFADGELFVRIDKNARGRDVVILQPTNAPAENMMELLLLIDAATRASAARVTAVVPYFGYGRQDRKDQPRVAIGANTRYFREKGLKDLVVVAPDVGSAKMARGYSKRLGATFAIIDKRRPAPNASEVMSVVGDVDGKTCILTDDMIDTGGTIANAVHALKERGATKVYAAATHALLSGSAAEKLSAAPLEELVVTNTIHIPEERRFARLTVLSVAELLADAIRFIHSNESVSALFEIKESEEAAHGRPEPRALGSA
jgi:ribose-phosphate pyrophosphokinase